MNALKERFSVTNIATVRHPIDQWLSLRELALLRGRITLAAFLKGYLRFAEHCVKTDFIRYEDFTCSPEKELSNLCRHLDIPYDPEFKKRWSEYTKITGEVKSRRAGNEISPVPRRQMEPGLPDAFVKNKDYIRALDLLGYKHPQ